MLIRPDWPAPGNVRALATTRLPPPLAGAEPGRYGGFNLASHVDDDPVTVASNRRALLAAGCGDGLREIYWLNQIHSTEPVVVPRDDEEELAQCPTADASIIRRPGIASAVLTADCLPVLLCNRGGDEVAAAHAGWRGLCNGILRETLGSMAAPSDEILVWLGPAISAAHFEVGSEVREAFLHNFVGPAQSEIKSAFVPSLNGDNGASKYFADLYALARMQLHSLGVNAIYGGDCCTYGDAERFFSYRRDARCGRQASLVWLND